MNITFNDKEAFEIARRFLQGGGYCFRARKEDLILEFYLESAKREAILFFNNLGITNNIKTT